MGDMKNAYKILVGKYEGKLPLGRPRRRWGVILKRLLNEIFLHGVVYN